MTFITVYYVHYSLNLNSEVCSLFQQGVELIFSLFTWLDFTYCGNGLRYFEATLNF